MQYQCCIFGQWECCFHNLRNYFQSLFLKHYFYILPETGHPPAVNDLTNKVEGIRLFIATEIIGIEGSMAIIGAEYDVMKST